MFEILYFIYSIYIHIPFVKFTWQEIEENLGDDSENLYGYIKVPWSWKGQTPQEGNETSVGGDILEIFVDVELVEKVVLGTKK